MRKLFAIAALILVATVTVGCLDQAEEPTVSPAATSALKVTAPAVVNRSEYATFLCQLNMTRGSGLDNKEIRWSIDNVYKETSRTIWGFAALNLTVDQTQELTIGKHVLTATFPGDYDYAGSNATTTFSVQTAASPTPNKATPRPEDTKASISLNVPNYQVKPGSATLTGTYSGLGNQYLYVAIRAPGAVTYKVQSPPIRYLNGTYSVNVNFESSGNNGIVALITMSAISGSSINDNDIQKALANSTGSVRVQ